MTRKLGWLLLALMGISGAAAALAPGTISGVVRNSAGIPQMGASVQIMPSAAALAVVAYTDDHGHFRATGLNPGLYSVKVSAASFLPTIRERITLRAGANMVVNLTLNTLFEAIQMVPRSVNTAEEKDDWRWTLRSMANRPILRLAGDGPLVVVHDSEDNGNGVLKARVSFVAGGSGDALSSQETSTQFQMEHSLLSNGRLGVAGSIDSSGTGSGLLSTTYSRAMPDGSVPELSITAARYASPNLLASRAALETLALKMSNTMVFEGIDLQYGGQTQMAAYGAHAVAFSPFALARLHLGENDQLLYGFSGLPSQDPMGVLSSLSPALGDGTPRVSLDGQNLRIERARHQEIAFSHRRKNSRMQVAAYSDRVRDLSLVGIGQGFGDGVIPDTSANSFLYNGGGYNTTGFRALYQRDIFNQLTVTANYAFGGALNAPAAGSTFSGQNPASFTFSRHHTLAARLSGTIPASKTQLAASYRWNSGTNTLTPVDAYSMAPGGSTGPFLNLSLRQPLPKRITQCNVEVLLDVRNLLAQGYRPVLSSDGETLYLVQMARTFRGGLSFTF